MSLSRRRRRHDSVVVSVDIWLEAYVPIAQLQVNHSQGSVLTFLGPHFIWYVQWTLCCLSMRLLKWVDAVSVLLVSACRNFNDHPVFWMLYNPPPLKLPKLNKKKQVRYSAARYWILSPRWTNTAACHCDVMRIITLADGRRLNIFYQNI